MNALFITPTLTAGGAERQASILLPGLRRRGVDARMLSLGVGGPFEEPLRTAGVPVEVLNMRGRTDVRPFLRSAMVRDFAPDVIVSRGVNGLYLGQLLAWRRRAPHIHNEHRGVGLTYSRRRKAMIRLLAGRLASVIVVSPDQRAVWHALGCPQQRIVFIPNGVEAPTASDGRGAVRRELGIADDAVVAMMVASLKPVKRVPDFVRALGIARVRAPGLVGVLVGEGDERPAVEAAADGDRAIHLLGHRDDVHRLLPAADMLVLSSAQEAGPMAILEGMAAGLPVVATAVGGIPNIVADGESGLLVPPADPPALADALVKLAENPQLRASLGRAGERISIERHGAETMIEDYLRVLGEAVARRR